MDWFKTEREKWADRDGVSKEPSHLGLPASMIVAASFTNKYLPRNVLLPRLTPDKPRVNYWMAPHDLARHSYVPGQIILGKFAGQFLGRLDDRPQVTIASTRAGKTSTVLEPNLYLYPGSMLMLDPKCELARSARFRRALGHDVYVLDPFGKSGEASAFFNVA